MNLREIIDAGFSYRVIMERDEIDPDVLSTAVANLECYYSGAQHADYYYFESDDVRAFFFKRRDIATAFVDELQKWFVQFGEGEKHFDKIERLS